MNQGVVGWWFRNLWRRMCRWSHFRHFSFSYEIEIESRSLAIQNNKQIVTRPILDHNDDEVDCLPGMHDRAYIISRMIAFVVTRQAAENHLCVLHCVSQFLEALLFFRLIAIVLRRNTNTPHRAERNHA